jgi:extracellular elastinolytic metalloproteinase
VKEIDKRDFSYAFDRNLRRSQLEALVKSVSEGLPAAHHLELTGVRSLTGSAELASFSAPPVTGRSLIDAALEYVTQASPALGFSPSAPVEFVPDPHVHQTSSAAASVHLQQYYRGVPVFQVARTVRFSPQHELTDIVGDSVDLPPGLDLAPVLAVEEAVLAAARHVAAPDEDDAGHDAWGQPVLPVQIDLAHYRPQVLAAFSLPSRPTVLEAGPFGAPAQASLTLIPLGPSTRLGWHVQLTLPDRSNRYALIVAADRQPGAEPGEILYCKALVQDAVGRGHVFVESPGRGDRVPMSFPRGLEDYPLRRFRPLPDHFPGAWLEEPRTEGNNVHVCLNETEQGLSGQKDGNAVIFGLAQPDGDDQRMLNLFYFCNYMHDFFYMLGFDEQAGCFQVRNLQGGPGSNDSVKARVHSGAVRGTANMWTPPDGQQPEMNMGLVEATNRHTALDCDVVFHEYVHGVTNRLVGGRINASALEQPQSRGMGEGWSDYFALTLQSCSRPAQSEKVVVGDWVANRAQGVRGLPYNDAFPDGFGSIGKGRYREEHNLGELWCATLMQMNRRLADVFGGDVPRGHQLGWQLVVDGLKLTPSNPSFLDARDAILRALDDMHRSGRLTQPEHGTARRAIWGTFARFGMGPGARSNGASLTGIQADHSDPTLPAA